VQLEDFLRRSISRRTAMKASAATFLMSQMALFQELALVPNRAALAATTFSDVQFDLGAFINGPVSLSDGADTITAQFGPVFNLFIPATLNRNPSKADQTVFANALNTIEANFSASPSGLLIGSVSYGVPYFNRFSSALVGSKIPRLSFDNTRFALEEAVASPTDVVQGKVGGPNAPVPNVTKQRFNVNVVIEANEVLFQFKSDSVDNLTSVAAWLQGSNKLNGNAVASPDFDGLFDFEDARLQFTQIGLPRKVANAAASKNAALYEYNGRINPDSPMFMGFLDQQTNAAAAPQVVTFVGSSKGVFTNAKAGDYFDNGSIIHFSHNIEDLFQFYETPAQDPGGHGEPYTERFQYMFRSNQLGTTDGLRTDGNTDQFTNGGGPAYIENVFQGTDAALRGARDSAGTFGPNNATLDATFQGQHRIGHEAALQRSSRAADGTPLHIRNDGPGFDGMDVPAFQDFPGTSGANSFPAGTFQPKLQFAVFVPTAEFFRAMRANAAAQDLQVQFNVDGDDNGLERFITATRRQNFLTPPRRHRAFPLVELT
jgi:hypothetical protein